MVLYCWCWHSVGVVGVAFFIHGHGVNLRPRASAGHLTIVLCGRDERQPMHDARVSRDVEGTPTSRTGVRLLCLHVASTHDEMEGWRGENFDEE
jgi:hypothetical protein